ncbi:MAG: hypothetical protein GY725_16810 [bacterium]|nr:hypothetical protein [bacterium]
MSGQSPENQSGSLRKFAGVVGPAVVLLVLWFGWQMLSPGEDEPVAQVRETPELGTSTTGEVASKVQGARTKSADSGEAVDQLTLAPHGRVTLEAARIPVDQAFAVVLELNEASPDTEPLETLILAEDGRKIETTSKVNETDRKTVRLDVAPDFLVPGRYMVQIRTKEADPFPLIRYVIIVR